jgi:hypothetical protein
MDKETLNKKTKGMLNLVLLSGHKTDIDSQIKAVETLSENFFKLPVFTSIIQSLKELRAIKRKENG